MCSLKKCVHLNSKTAKYTGHVVDTKKMALSLTIQAESLGNKYQVNFSWTLLDTCILQQLYQPNKDDLYWTKQRKHVKVLCCSRTIHPSLVDRTCRTTRMWKRTNMYSMTTKKKKNDARFSMLWFIVIGQMWRNFQTLSIWERIYKNMVIKSENSMAKILHNYENGSVRNITNTICLSYLIQFLKKYNIQQIWDLILSGSGITYW